MNVPIVSAIYACEHVAEKGLATQFVCVAIRECCHVHANVMIKLTINTQTSALVLAFWRVRMPANILEKLHLPCKIIQKVQLFYENFLNCRAICFRCHVFFSHSNENIFSKERRAHVLFAASVYIYIHHECHSIIVCKESHGHNWKYCGIQNI